MTSEQKDGLNKLFFWLNPSTIDVSRWAMTVTLEVCLMIFFSINHNRKCLSLASHPWMCLTFVPYKWHYKIGVPGVISPWSKCSSFTLLVSLVLSKPHLFQTLARFDCYGLKYFTNLDFPEIKNNILPKCSMYGLCTYHLIFIFMIHVCKYTIVPSVASGLLNPPFFG